MSIDAAYDWAMDVFAEPPENDTLDSLPDTYYWKPVLQNLNTDRLYEKLGLPRIRGILLSGAPGNGKHTLLDALVTDIWKREGIRNPEAVRYSHLRAEDFSEGLTMEQAQQRVEALFQVLERYLESGTAEFAFLVFDQMERYAYAQVLQNAILDGILDLEQDNFFVICITEKEEKIYGELKSLLLHCRCNSPGKNQRENYLEKNLTWEVADWEHPSQDFFKQISITLSGMTMEEAAEKTEGFSYGDLNRFVYLLKMELVKKTLADFSQAVNVVNLEKEVVEACLEAVRPAAKNAAGGLVIQPVVSTVTPSINSVKEDDEKKRLTEKPVEEMSVEEQRRLMEIV